MGRAKGNLIDALAVLPWPAGVVFGIVGFVALRFGLPAMLHGNPFAQAVVPAANLMSWFALAVGLGPSPHLIFKATPEQEFAGSLPRAHFA